MRAEGFLEPNIGRSRNIPMFVWARGTPKLGAIVEDDMSRM
jgi:hypothetical protein